MFLTLLQINVSDGNLMKSRHGYRAREYPDPGVRATLKGVHPIQRRNRNR